MDHKFQINLGGVIDLLSNHLYSSPAVYLRELLQNGVDAIRARQHFDSSHSGSIRLELHQTDDGQAQLIFRDDGIGLTEGETHRFLATIGESSKRLDESTRADFIGQFGIGLLSCFIVCDEIVMVTLSARSPEFAVEWRGRADGTYTVKSGLAGETKPGTTVYLRCKPGSEDWFKPERIEALVRHYGGLLPYPVHFESPTGEKLLNDPNVPWRTKFESKHDEWYAHMDFGRRVFNQEFFDAIPLKSDVGDVDGVAYILNFSPSPTAKRAHRVYLKGMLLSEASENLLPPWAFFVTCVVNTNGLRPVASRESFYEDETLKKTRTALGDALRDYLVHLRHNDPQRLHALISIHYRAIKALATHDDEFYRIFIDVLPFETSQGSLTMGDFRKRNEVVRYVTSIDTFRQIAQVAASQGMGVINAGYSYDAELIQRLPQLLDVDVERIDSVDLADNFENLLPEEDAAIFEFLAIAETALSSHQCRANVKKFKPTELPALYLTTEETKYRRQMEQTRQTTDAHWGGILDSLISGQTQEASAELCFNYTNPLVRKLVRMDDPEVLKTAIQMLYLQALLLGHHPLNATEMGLLNTGLIDLIELALNKPTQGWVQ